MLLEQFGRKSQVAEVQEKHRIDTRAIKCRRLDGLWLTWLERWEWGRVGAKAGLVARPQRVLKTFSGILI